MNNIDYKQKYLKYKQKYLYLKNVQQGGSSLPRAVVMTKAEAKAEAEYMKVLNTTIADLPVEFENQCKELKGCRQIGRTCYYVAVLEFCRRARSILVLFKNDKLDSVIDFSIEMNSICKVTHFRIEIAEGKCLSLPQNMSEIHDIYLKKLDKVSQTDQTKESLSLVKGGNPLYFLVSIFEYAFDTYEGDYVIREVKPRTIITTELVLIITLVKTLQLEDLMHTIMNMQQINKNYLLIGGLIRISNSNMYHIISFNICTGNTNSIMICDSELDDCFLLTSANISTYKTRLTSSFKWTNMQIQQITCVFVKKDLQSKIAEIEEEEEEEEIKAELELLVAETVLPSQPVNEYGRSLGYIIPVLISKKGQQTVTFPNGTMVGINIPSDANPGDMIWIIDSKEQSSYYSKNLVIEVKIDETWVPNTYQEITFPSGSIMFIRLPSNIQSGQIIRVKPPFNPYSPDITKGIGTVIP